MFCTNNVFFAAGCKTFYIGEKRFFFIFFFQFFF